jgi:RNA polymerase sigma-54 factor
MNSTFSQSQNQSNKQGYYLSTHHMQFMHLLHLSGHALDEYLENQLEENPLLELAEKADDDNSESGETKEYDEEFFDDAYKEDYKLQEKNYGSSSSGGDEEIYQAPVIQFETFYEKLKAQIELMKITEEQKKITCYIVDALEEDGYLKRENKDISYDYSFSSGTFISEEEVDAAIKILQRCEPLGIGARNLQECLLLQLNAMKQTSGAVEIAKTILTDYYDKLVNRNLPAITNALGISSENLSEALQLIQTLNPKPNADTDKYELFKNQIAPSFEVIYDGHEFSVAIVNSKFGNLSVSQTIEEFTKRDFGNAKNEKSEKKYWIKMASDAQSLVEAIKQREKTMMAVISSILKLQTDFFKYGDKRFLQPMILEQVANIAGCDISTVSRITSNKYVQTSYGCFLLKDLFSSSINGEEGQVSSHKVKELIEEIIKNENKKSPLTDNQIVDMLKEMGISIARRTIVKYRDMLGIPTYSLRNDYN